MVGSLLVGRQIVDRAKVQKYISELDYFEKNFHMFYDTYRTVPGHLSRKTCLKYREFDEIGCGFCSKIPDTIQNAKLMQSDTRDFVYRIYSSEFEIGSGRITEHGVYEGCYQRTGYIEGMINYKQVCTCEGCCNGTMPGEGARNMLTINPLLNWQWMKSSVQQYTYVRFSGFDFAKQLKVLGGYTNMMFAASNKSQNKTLPHEIDNANFRKVLDLHNAVYYDTDRGVSQKSITTDTTTGATTTTTTRNNSVFSAKMASELDAKVDDGRPGSGKILALKGGAAHNANTSEDKHKKVCYDQMADQVDKAIYETSTDIKYGCNIIKVMEDVK